MSPEELPFTCESLHPSRKKVDITNSDAVHDCVDHHKIDTLIHTATMTGIRECKENKELAWKTNVGETRNVLNACLHSKPNSYFIHISTACVSHGDRGPNGEEFVLRTIDWSLVTAQIEALYDGS